MGGRENDRYKYLSRNTEGETDFDKNIEEEEEEEWNWISIEWGSSQQGAAYFTFNGISATRRIYTPRHSLYVRHWLKTAFTRGSKEKRWIMSHMADLVGTLQNSSCKDFMQKFSFLL